MNLLEHFQALLDYEKRANAATSQSLRDAGDVSEKAILIFAHIQAVRELWLLRLGNQPLPEGFDAFPTWTLSKSCREMERMNAEWSLFLDTLEPDAFDQPLVYRDTKGGRYETRLHDALVQAFNHSAHHRGQIALLLRHFGAEPAITDYIAFHRKKQA